jgi:hypothetical protein
MTALDRADRNRPIPVRGIKKAHAAINLIAV